MSDMQRSIRDGLLSGGEGPRLQKNTPAQYAGRQRQYFGDDSSRFIGEYARYASDFIEAEAQGLTGDDPAAWTPVRLRVADVIRPSASAMRRFDDYKMVLLERPRTDYIRPGTKFRMMGSVWLAINPANISSASANGIVQRCGAVWNYLDYYGNLCSEPLAIEKLLANANDQDAQQLALITKGYFNVKAQYNDATRQLRENSRMILGSGAYRVTGFSDFHSEFTGDYGAVRMLEFTLRYEEPNDSLDDMERHVAGGKTFSWEIAVTGAKQIAAGTSMQLSAVSRRCGEPVRDTAEHPVTYVWSSSNPAAAAVDEKGAVTALAAGEAVITATLKENPERSGTLLLTVSEAADGASIRFRTAPPAELRPMERVTLEAVYTEDGAETEAAVTWDAAGAENGSCTVETVGPRAEITCWHGSVTPLIVTVSCGGVSARAEIALLGL